MPAVELEVVGSNPAMSANKVLKLTWWKRAAEDGKGRVRNPEYHIIFIYG